MTTQTDALVIGGGIAGSAVAALLARAGRDVVAIERKPGPHDKVCGEFISSEAALYLRDLGIDLDAIGAVRIAKVRICARNSVVESDLPFSAFSVSRRVLDETILKSAAARGAEVWRGHAVRSLHPLDGRWIAETDDGAKTAAQDAFLATGKHDLRGWKRPLGRQNDLIAFKLHFCLTAEQTARLNSSVELFLFPGGYAGLELVENGIANLCLVIRRAHFALLDNRWDRLLSALRDELLPLYERLAGAEARWERPLAIASIPYGHVQNRGDGPWRLGDQAAVIPSFCGDGIAIALHSARLAAHYYVTGKTAPQFQSHLARDISDQVRRATLLSRMLVHAEGQAIGMALARLAPTLIGYVADRTRIQNRLLVGTNRPAILPVP